jgi:sugar phosphate isomerase/epimerase
MFILAASDYSLTWEESVARLRGGLEQLLPECERHGVRLALEPAMTVRCDLTFLHSEWDAAAIAASLDSPYMGVVVETQVLWRERDIPGFARAHRDRLFTFQLSDWTHPTYCASQRAVIGDGVIPLRHLVRSLYDAGYRGWHDIELLGSALEEEGYASALGRSMAKLRELLAELPQ